MKSHFTGLGVVLAFAGIAIGQEKFNPQSNQPKRSERAVEVLKNGKEAAAKIESITYMGCLEGEGTLKDKMTQVVGRVVAQKAVNGGNHKVFINATITRPGGDKGDQFRFASDGQTAVSVDDRNKVYASGNTQDARNVPASGLLPPWFLGDSVFDTALNAYEINYEGTIPIRDVSCHVITVAYDRLRRQQLKFFIGEEDYLLRRYVRPFRITVKGSEVKSDSSVAFSVDQLKINQPVDSRLFKIDAPEGYRKEALAKQNTRGKQSGATLKVGTPAPDWTMTTKDGKHVSLRDLRGQVVVLDFWATWCGPCKRAMPGMQKLYERFKGKPVAIYGVNCRERSPRANPMAYIDKMGFTYGQFTDGNTAANAYGVRGIPAFFVIGKKGEILHMGRGYNPKMDEVLAQVIDRGLQ